MELFSFIFDVVLLGSWIKPRNSASIRNVRGAWLARLGILIIYLGLVLAFFEVEPSTTSKVVVTAAVTITVGLIMARANCTNIR